MENKITPVKIQELVQGGDRNTIIDIYKESNPNERNKILQILGALGGFVALLKFLKGLR